MSLPCATASRFPCTKLPTITEAGPTDVSVTHPDELPETWCCWSAPISVSCVVFVIFGLFISVLQDENGSSR